MADPGFLIIPLFFIIFPLFWMAIVKLISLFGWRKFVNDRMMRTEPPPDAQKFAMQSMTIGGMGNYRNCHERMDPSFRPVSETDVDVQHRPPAHPAELERHHCDRGKPDHDGEMPCDLVLERPAEN